MFIIRSVFQAVVAGFGAFLASCGLYIVLGIVMWNSNKANSIASGLAPYLILIAAVIGFLEPIVTELKNQNQEAEALRRQRQVEADALKAAQARAQSQFDYKLGIVRQYGRDAAGEAIQLPGIVARAELALDRAAEEFAEGLYSPFWEAMEEATHRLHEFDSRLHQIVSLRSSYIEQAPALGLGAETPSFSLGTDSLPDTSIIQERLRQMYRQAQKDGKFAQIYEQRRTNSILIKGFTSLGDAIQRLGSKIADSLDELRHEVGFRLTDLESALQSAAENAQHQREEMLTELRDSNAGNKETLELTRRDVAQRRETEQTALKMLDNIQHRRKPSPGDSP